MQQTAKEITMAVPRSGSFAISTQREPDHEQVGTEPAEGPGPLRLRRSR